MSTIQRRFQRLCISTLIIAVAILSPSLGRIPAFAATCPNPVDAAAGSASCDTNIALDIGPGTLTLQSDPNVAFTSSNVTTPTTGNPYIQAGSSAQTVTFTFHNYVRNNRNDQSGWGLSVSSAGLTNTAGGPAITAITLSGDQAGSTCLSTCVRDIPTLNFNTVTLTSSPQVLVNAFALGGVPNHGDYNILANGSFTVPPNVLAGSTYTGIITTVLTNAPA